MNNNFQIIVQKYGGSSMADSHKIKAVAQVIQSSVQSHKRICVVVSAMGTTTNELTLLAHEISINPPKRELDMLISCGERSSMALLAMALNEIGVKAISLTGSQSGIITNDTHGGAEIIAVKPHRVLDAFLAYQVVIIAGFQGISERKEITTLKRGGSDTTAVAMAAALNADICEIYTDVAGVMDIDPKITSHAKILPVISFDQMESMALYGASVIAHDAIRLAKELGISLRVAKTGVLQFGTKVCHIDFEADSEKRVIGITHLRALVRFSLNRDELGSFSKQEGYFLCGYFIFDKFVGYISNDISQKFISAYDKKISSGLALITVHFQKNQLALSILVEISSLLKKHDIAMQDLIVGRNEIFVIVSDSFLKKALEVIHAALLTKGVSS
jgi:aspartokinase